MRAKKVPGDDLLSHPVAKAVPSAQRGLTSEFGMGSGDPPRYSHREKILVNKANSAFEKTKVLVKPDGQLVSLG